MHIMQFSIMYRSFKAIETYVSIWNFIWDYFHERIFKFKKVILQNNLKDNLKDNFKVHFVFSFKNHASVGIILQYELLKSTAQF